MDSQIQQRIEGLIASSPVVVFMKGNKLMPQCGFSNNVVQILHALGVPFETFDVLSDICLLYNFDASEQLTRVGHVVLSVTIKTQQY